MDNTQSYADAASKDCLKDNLGKNNPKQKQNKCDKIKHTNKFNLRFVFITFPLEYICVLHYDVHVRLLASPLWRP